MQERTTVSVTEFCRHHQIEPSFVHSLQEYGLLQVESITAEDWQVSHDELDRLESLVRLHYDLHINLEGLDAINYLLHRLENLQKEVLLLRSRLRIYEGPPPAPPEEGHPPTP